MHQEVLSVNYITLSPKENIILPQLLCSAPIWSHKNVEVPQTFQNSRLKSFFKHDPSPPNQTSQAPGAIGVQVGPGKHQR